MSLHAFDRHDPVDPLDSRDQEAVDGGYRFTMARLLIDGTKDELSNNPAFTRALAGRYFTNVAGMPNDASRHTMFVQDDAHYRVGYEYRFDDTGGWREKVEIVRQAAEREERLVVEAAQYLAEASDSRFRVDGHITYAVTDAAEGAADNPTADAYKAAQAIVRGLCTTPEPRDS